MADEFRLEVDGRELAASPGETILQVLRRNGIETPALCYHEELHPAKACRACVVEVEGNRTLVASCERKAEAGLKIHTQTERVQRARKGVFELLASESDLSTAPDFQAYAERYAVDPGRYGGSRWEHPVIDDNGLFVRDYSKCILCYRCVEACGADAQNTFAIALSGRGFDSGISTGYDLSLPDSVCVFCGNCVAVCPTGALMDSSEYELRHAGAWHPQQQEVVQTTCPYCGVGCQLELHVDPDLGQVVKVTSPTGHDITHGSLCVKGRYGYAFLQEGRETARPGSLNDVKS